MAFRLVLWLATSHQGASPAATQFLGRCVPAGPYLLGDRRRPKTVQVETPVAKRATESVDSIRRFDERAPPPATIRSWTVSLQPPGTGAGQRVLAQGIQTQPSPGFRTSGNCADTGSSGSWSFWGGGCDPDTLSTLRLRSQGRGLLIGSLVPFQALQSDLRSLPLHRGAGSRHPQLPGGVPSFVPLFRLGDGRGPVVKCVRNLDAPNYVR